jgi:ketosteroid isomerase-like protein
MRSFLQTLLLTFLLTAGAARAQDALPPGDAAIIRQIIQDQLAAFRADDGERAFGFASPDIQAMFHDPQTFLGMVRGGYQPVYRPREVEFRDLVPVQGRLTQRVLVVGPDGVPVVAQYVMERQPDGSWRIDGCTLERSAEQTT